MATLRSIGLMALGGLALGGCAIERDLVQSRENMLAAAGFTVRPADSADRQAMLANLPANRVSQQIRGETVSYLYPDPVVCHCLYVGGQAEWARYQRAIQQQRIANERVEAARLDATSWNWGPWGGFGPGYGAGFGPGFYP